MKTTKPVILYEDSDILVCVKPHGVATQSKNIRTPDMESLLKKHLAMQSSGGREPYLAVIHRLDQPVSGILVFAKNPAAAAFLNKELQQKEFHKHYRALVTKMPEKAETEETALEHYVVKDGKTNTSRICTPDTPGAKYAKLHYRITEKNKDDFHWGADVSELLSKITPAPTELEIHLDTGRHHQIRVQLASIGCPILGDGKYNPDAGNLETHKLDSDNLTPNNSGTAKHLPLCLCAFSLSFRHPKTKKRLTYRLANDPS